MQLLCNFHHAALVLRWSYTVPVLCYFTFFLMIWILSLPLKPINTVKEIRTRSEESFEIRLKNSNFNSDKRDGDKSLLNNKNEYLINVNGDENVDKDQTEILREVFLK